MIEEKEKIIIDLFKGLEACLGCFIACLLIVSVCLSCLFVTKAMCYYNRARNKDKYLSVKEIYDIVKKDSEK